MPEQTSEQVYREIAPHSGFVIGRVVELSKGFARLLLRDGRDALIVRSAVNGREIGMGDTHPEFTGKPVALPDVSAKVGVQILVYVEEVGSGRNVLQQVARWGFYSQYLMARDQIGSRQRKARLYPSRPLTIRPFEGLTVPWMRGDRAPQDAIAV